MVKRFLHHVMLPLMVMLHTVNLQMPVVGVSCSDIGLDFTNANSCASMEEFEAAFLGLYQAVHNYIFESSIDEGLLMEGDFAVTDTWMNQDGTLAGGGSNNGASYAIVKGYTDSGGGRKERRLLMVNDNASTPKEMTIMAEEENRHLDTVVDCPIYEECNADWCCMMCGTNCSRRRRALRHQRDLVTPSDICSFVESYYLEGCLEWATVVCTIVSY